MRIVIQQLRILIFTLLGIGLLAGGTLAQSETENETQLTFNEKLQILRDSNPPVNLKLKEIPLKDALELIAQKTETGLYYDAEILPDKTVSVEFSGTLLGDALKEVLNGTGLEAFTSGRNIMLRKRVDEITIQKEHLKKIIEIVRGTVTDGSSGESLPGVNIVIKGTSVGTSTNTDGSYELNVPSLTDTLVVSFIGYLTQEVPISGRTNIDISLSPDVQQFEDVVVVGYGTQEKQQITGSVSSVKSDEFVSGNVNNAAELIQGKVPGLTITNEGGNPNSSPTIRLRGISTFSANQSPLIVIDGIIGASLENLDPNDIESIDVLKDASASAIYGTRGAAGVIEVSTKRGNTGDFTVNYNGIVSFVGIENKLDILTANEFRDLAKETSLTVKDEGFNTNWYDEITQNGFNNSHSLAVSGGNGTTNYRVSGNFRDNLGIQKKTGFEQINGRINLNQKALNDKLDVTFNIALTNREEELGFDAAFRYATIYNPTFPVRAEDFETTGGFYAIEAFDLFNPVNVIETGKNQRTRDNLNGALRVEYEFADLVPGLSTTLFYSLEKESISHKTFFARTNTWQGGATPGKLGTGNAQRSVSDDQSELFEFTLNYQNESLGKLRFESVIGYSFNDFITEGTTAGGGDFVSDYVEFSNLAFAQDFRKGLGNVSSFDNSHRIIGYFGRVNLNWDDTYFVNGSIRREASSRFGNENKWGTFGSAGVGLELASLLNLSFFDQFKLRSSFGITGQDAPFSGISKIRFGPSGFFFANGEFIQQFGPVSNSNPNLKWEENHEWNVGADFELFDSRLVATTEYYIKNTKDLLFNVEVPVPPNLFPTGWRNIGNLENKGFDASLQYDVVQKQQLRWNTGFTFSTFNTVLKKYITNQAVFTANAGSPGQNNTDMVRIKEGEPIGQIWGPRFAEISSDGEWLFFNNAGEKVTFDQISREDERVVGNGLPDFSLGWTNSLNFKNWDLTTFIRGVFGHDMINTFRLFYEAPSQITTYNVVSSAKDISNLKSSPKYSNFFVEDASFIRLQNLAIGYNVPLSSASQVRRLRFSLSGNNLFTITGYDGIDPEVNFVDPVDGGALAPGIERRNSWFTTRSVSFGIELQF